MDKNNYVVTFFSHYNAVLFSRNAKAQGIAVTLCPVPRALSSSCGTCARFSTAGDPAALLEGVEFEQLVQEQGGAFINVLDRR